MFKLTYHTAIIIGTPIVTIFVESDSIDFQVKIYFIHISVVDNATRHLKSCKNMLFKGLFDFYVFFYAPQ